MSSTPDIPQYPDDLLNDRQKAFLRQIAGFGKGGVSSDYFNLLLRRSDLSNEDWRKMLDLDLFDTKEVAKVTRISVKALLSKAS